MTSACLILDHIVQLDVVEGYETYQCDETKSLHDFSDSVDALIGVDPNSADDCLDEVGSKPGRCLHRVAWVDNHTVDNTTFVCDSCKVVVG